MGINMADLICNVVALDIVLNIDELLYVSILPLTVRDVIPATEPLNIPYPKMYLAQLTNTFVVIGSAILILTAVYFHYLQSIVVNMASAQHFLCGGSLDFIAITRQSGMVKVGPHQQVTDNPFQRYESRAVYDRAFHHVRCNEALQDTFYASWCSATTLKEVHRQYTEPLAEIWMPCDDFEWSMSSPILQERTGQRNLTSCVDAARYCGSTHQPLVRFYCARTCGCQNPRSGLFAVEGCPNMCSSEAQRWYEDFPCIDLRLDTASGIYPVG